MRWRAVGGSFDDSKAGYEDVGGSAQSEHPQPHQSSGTCVTTRSPVFTASALDLGSKSSASNATTDTNTYGEFGAPGAHANASSAFDYTLKPAFASVDMDIGSKSSSGREIGECSLFTLTFRDAHTDYHDIVFICGILGAFTRLTPVYSHNPGALQAGVFWKQILQPDSQHVKCDEGEVSEAPRAYGLTTTPHWLWKPGHANSTNFDADGV